jgi:hypothetical protein
MNSTLKKIAGTILCSAAFMSSYAIGNTAKRSEIGYSIPSIKADYTLILLDTTISEKVQTKGGFGIIFGNSINLAKFGDNGALQIGIDGMFDILVWDLSPVNQTYSGYSGYSTEYEITGGTMRFGVPISADFKFGAEATLNKKKRGIFTFGAGFAPTAALTAYETDADAKIKIQPFVKAELGIVAGIGFKLRMQYNLGKFDYIRLNPETEYNLGSAGLRGTSAVTFSLVLMPFGFAWKNYEW